MNGAHLLVFDPPWRFVLFAAVWLLLTATAGAFAKGVTR